MKRGDTPFYESDRAVAEYLLFHYGAPDLLMPWPDGPTNGLRFPARCAQTALAAAGESPVRRALDLGCAVGGASFELARHAADVVGVDSSHRFIEAARHIALTGAVEFPVTLQGNRSTRGTALVPAIPAGHRLEFTVGDALQPDPAWGTFDLVLAANLLDRVPEPARLLAGLAGLVRPGGTLLLTSPYTWMPEYTPPDRWLVGQDQPTVDLLGQHLVGFERTLVTNLPFVIREHERKYQWSVAEATGWRRKHGSPDAGGPRTT